MRGQDEAHTQPFRDCLLHGCKEQGNLVLPYVRRLRLKRVFSIKAGVICFFHTADLFGRGGSLDKF